MRHAGPAAAALLFLVSAQGTAGAEELRLSFVNGTDRMIDYAYMACDAGEGSLMGMGGEMMLHPGRSGSLGTDAERISSASFAAGTRRYDFADLSALPAGEAAVRICIGADGVPELRGNAGRTAPASCGEGAAVARGAVFDPLADAGEGAAASPDALLAPDSPQALQDIPSVPGSGTFFEGFRFFRSTAAGRPLAVRMEIEESMFDGEKLLKTVLSGAAADAEPVLAHLREKGLVPVFVQRKTGDSQDDAEHRTFFDDGEAGAAWECLFGMIRALREGGDIPSVTCLLISGADLGKARGASPDITAVRGDFSLAADFRLAIHPHAGDLVDAVR